MNEPVGGGWTAPGARPPASPPPAPDPQQQPQAQAPQAQSPQGPPQAPAWQGHPGWGAPVPPAPPAQGAHPGWGGKPQTGQPASAQPAWSGQPGWGAPPPSAPRPGVVPLRPLGLGELLDGAVGLVRRYPRPVLTVAVLVAATSTVLQLLLLFTALRPLFEVDTLALEAGDTDQLLGLLAGAGAAGVVTLVFGTFTNALMSGLLTVVAGRGVLGQPLSTAELWTAVRPRLARVLGGSLLSALAVYGPVLLAGALAGLLVVALGGPGAVAAAALVLGTLVLVVVTYVRLSFAPSVVVLEDAGVLASLRRSWRLVRGGTWRVLGVLLLALLVSSIVGQVLQFPLALLGGGGPFALDTSSGLSSTSVLLTTVGAGVAGAVTAPFFAGVVALLYVDRRMRTEGLDVALQAAAAQQR